MPDAMIARLGPAEQNRHEDIVQRRGARADVIRVIRVTRVTRVIRVIRKSCGMCERSCTA